MKLIISSVEISVDTTNSNPPIEMGSQRTHLEDQSSTRSQKNHLWAKMKSALAWTRLNSL